MAEPVTIDARGGIEALRDLLRQRFPEAAPLDGPNSGLLPSGIEAVDALLSGGIPRGALSLLSGSVSCGKTGLALAFAAEITRQQGRLAWVHQGSFSAPSARHAGVDLEAVLTVRVESFPQARRCVDFLLRWQAFQGVVVDWPGFGGSGKAWTRLHRLVSGSQGLLLVITPDLPDADPLRYCASVLLEIERDTRSSSLEFHLGKSRQGRAGSRCRTPWGGESSGFSLLPELPGLGQDWHDEVG